MIHTSAPGKIIFFGDHAVVYGEPCLSLAISQRLHVWLKPRNDNAISLFAQDLGMKEPVRLFAESSKRKIEKWVSYSEATIKKFEERCLSGNKNRAGFGIVTQSELYPGLGSSAALSVALTAALGEFYGVKLSKKDIFNLGMKILEEVEQAPHSGCDIATCTYGGFIRYVKNKVPLSLRPFKFPLIAIFTGKKASTTELVLDVNAVLNKGNAMVDRIFDFMGDIVDEAQKCIEKEDKERIGYLMNIYHHLLCSLSPSISSKRIEGMIYEAINDKKKGQPRAFGAKISGAGGGDFIIALVDAEEVDSFIAKFKRKYKRVDDRIFKIKVADTGVTTHQKREIAPSIGILR